MKLPRKEKINKTKEDEDDINNTRRSENLRSMERGVKIKR